MKISIITVCYNSEGTIGDTIESVLSQTYGDIEYIIVDGFSADSTPEILQSYADRVAMIVREPDNGIYDAMNKGIRLSTGDFVGILNSDDIFAHTRVIEEMVERLRENPGADGLYGDLVYVRRNDLSRVVRIFSSRYFAPWRIRFGFMCPHPTFYVRRSLFDRFGFYKPGYRVAADFELMVRFIRNGARMIRNPKVMVKMREGGISTTGFWWRIHQNLEIVRACRENGIYTNILLMSLKVPFKLIGYFTRSRGGCRQES